MAQNVIKSRKTGVCHAIVEFLGKFFFQSSKKTRGTGGTEAKIDYKCWYKRIIAVPRRRFSVAQRGTNGVFTSFFAVLPWHTLLLGARDLFIFREKKIA